MQTIRLSALLLAWASGAAASGYTVVSIANKPMQPADHMPAFDVAISGVPMVDRAGNVYLTGGGGTTMGGREVWKIRADGMLLPFAGQGSGMPSPGDRMPAVLAGLLYVGVMAADAGGNVYLAGEANGFTRTALYRVTPDGMIAIYLVTPTTWTGINDLSTDAAGNLYVLAETVTQPLVVKIAPDLTMTTVSQLPTNNMVADDAGNLYLSYVGQIGKLDPTGKLTTLAQLDSVTGMALDRNGNLYVAQEELGTVQRVSPNGAVTLVAGVGTNASYSGDGGPATAAGVPEPSRLAVDASGNLYIADSSRLRMVDTNGIIHTVAGCACGGDGVPITWVRTGAPLGTAVDRQGNVYYSDYQTNMVRRIAPDGTATVVAGTGEAGSSGDQGQARQARLWGPAGLALDTAENLYIAEEQGNRVRRVSTMGIITTVAGIGISGTGGDGGPATAAKLGLPDGVVVDAAGNLYIADTGSHRVRKVTTDGIIHTIAGSDQYGLAGDGGPATAALLINPRMLAFDQAGNLLVTDSAAHTVRKITPDGTILRVAGTGQAASGADGGPASATAVWSPWGIAVDAAGNILIGETGAFRVRMVDASGNLSTLYSTSADSLAMDAAGRIWSGGGGALTVAWQTTPPLVFAPLISDGGFTNAAMRQSSVVSPGEIVSIYGLRLAPSTPAGGSISGGVLQTEAGNVRVLFDGVPAPILYAGSGFGPGPTSGQVNAVAPYEIAGKSTVAVTVEYQGVASNPVTLDVVPAAPGLFIDPAGTLPLLAAINQNQTGNHPGNPAVAGSIVSLYGTGAGLTKGANADGQITGSKLSSPQLPVTASIGGRILGVTYAGDAPGFVSGALQVNVQLPDDLLTGYYYLELRVGSAISGSGILFTTAK